MSPRPLAISMLFFLIVIVTIYQTYVKLRATDLSAQIPSKEQWVGIIDMDANHGIDMRGILEGHDVILVVDNTNPLFQQLVRSPQELLTTPGPLEIGNYDQNNDGILDVQDPIYPYFHIISFDTNGEGYIEKTLEEAGIRGIRIKHITPYGNHQVVLSDGTIRTLYEINKPGVTSIYKSWDSNIVKILPEPTSTP